MLDLPVAIIFFTRPDKLREVFEQVRKAKPNKLFLIQDGPRKNNYEEDLANINKCREVVENIDWECEVYKDYSEINLGVGKRPATGISWVFENVDKAIILEDDCVPDLSFFKFSKEMLDKYEANEKIMLISGMNLLEEYTNNYSYTFSKACTIGAWATWKRVWEQYDFEIKKFDDRTIKKKLKKEIVFKNVIDLKFWAWNLTREKIKHNERLQWWDYQLSFLLYLNSGLGIVPSKNLIKNIGFGEGASNVSNKEDGLHFNIKRYKIESKLNHPKEIKWDYEFDKKLYDIQNIKINKLKVILSKIKRSLLRLKRR